MSEHQSGPYLWINKTSASTLLSRCEGLEARKVKKFVQAVSSTPQRKQALHIRQYRPVGHVNFKHRQRPRQILPRATDTQRANALPSVPKSVSAESDVEEQLTRVALEGRQAGALHSVAAGRSDSGNVISGSRRDRSITRLACLPGEGTTEEAEATLTESLQPEAEADVEDVGHPSAAPASADLLNIKSGASPAGANHTICRLGRDWSDLSQVCPVALDLPTQNLLHRLLDISPSNKFRGYRDAWLPLVLPDPAAFQQLLSTFALYLQRLDPSVSVDSGITTLMLHTNAIQSVNERMRSSGIGTDAGLLAVVISFIAHYRVLERYDLWRIHVQGLQTIISFFGGLERAFQDKPGLRIMLFLINSQGSWLQNFPAAFPPPYNLLPRLRDLPVDSCDLSSFHHASQTSRKWHETFPESPLIPDILDDLIMVTAHFTAESIRTKKLIGTDVIATGVLVNPLVHRLYGLRIKEPHRYCRSETLQEAFRIAALLYLSRAKWHPIFVSSLFDAQVIELKYLLSEANEDIWKDFNILRVWILVIGALCSHEHSAERLWYEKEILHVARPLESVGLPDLLFQVKSFLWFEDLFGDTAVVVWKELRMLS